MNRLDYLRTRRGQRAQYDARWRARRRFIVNQPLRGKGSMKPREKVAFQQALLESLERFSWPPFRADLTCELAFYSNQPTPPQLHTLAKNYLDLLGAAQHLTTTSRKHLVFRDDRQIKLLSVSYHLSAGLDSPSIHVEVDRLSRLRDDLSLLERIERDDFQRDDDSPSWRSHRRDRYDQDREDRAGEDMEEAFNSFNDMTRNRAFWEERLAPNVLDAMLQMEQQMVQEKFLIWNQLIIRRSVLGLLQRGRPARDKWAASLSEAVGAMHRQLLLSEPTTLDLTHAPTVEGDSNRFFRGISNSLSAFKRDRPWLFPLRLPIAATILVVPPPNGIDLDNLARKIVPIIHDLWSPPRTHLAQTDLASISDERLRTLFSTQLEAERRFPRTSLTRYEVVELPRIAKDPAEGFVRVALGSGTEFDTIRATIDDQIDNWERDLD